MCLFWLASGLWAQTPESAARIFAQGVEQFRAERLSRARSLFLQAQRAGLTSARLYYNLGVVHYRLGDYVVAKDYFQQATRFDSTAQIAFYNLARCAQALQDVTQAQRWYQQAEQGRDPRIADLAHRASLLLNTTARADWRANAQLAIGFDTAVVGLTDQVTALPTRTADVYQEAQLGVSYGGLPVSDGQLDIQVNAYQLAYESVEQADIQSVQSGLQWRRELSSRHRVGWRLHLAHDWLDRQAYQLRGGLGGQFGHSWKQLWLRYSVGAQWYEAQSGAVPGIGGSQFDVSVTAFRRVWRGLGYTRLFAQFNQRDDESNSPRRVGAQLYWRSAESAGWLWLPSLQWRESRYPEQQLPKEQRMRARIRLVNQLAGPWQSLVDVEHERNRSALASRAYDHTRIMLGLRWEAL